MSIWSLFVLYALILTYLVVGFIVAFEAVLCMGGSKIAVKWVRRLYNLRTFMFLVYLFYPMLLLAYLFLELIPYYFTTGKELTKFDIPMMLYNIFPDESNECDKK